MLVDLAAEIHRSLEIKLEPRRITVSLPFFPIENLSEAQLENKSTAIDHVPLVLIHQLYQAGT